MIKYQDSTFFRIKGVFMKFESKNSVAEAGGGFMDYQNESPAYERSALLRAGGIMFVVIFTVMSMLFFGCRSDVEDCFLKNCFLTVLLVATFSCCYFLVREFFIRRNPVLGLAFSKKCHILICYDRYGQFIWDQTRIYYKRPVDAAAQGIEGITTTEILQQFDIHLTATDLLEADESAIGIEIASKFGKELRVWTKNGDDPNLELAASHSPRNEAGIGSSWKVRRSLPTYSFLPTFEQRAPFVTFKSPWQKAWEEMQSRDREVILQQLCQDLPNRVIFELCLLPWIDLSSIKYNEKSISEILIEHYAHQEGCFKIN